MKRKTLILILASGGALGLGFLGRSAMERYTGPSKEARSELANQGFHLPSVASGSVADFSLIDQGGTGHELYRYGDARGIVITAQVAGMPAIPAFQRELPILEQKYQTAGIRFFLLNADPGDHREAAAKAALANGLKMPILMDPSQAVSRELVFQHAGETVLIDPRTWRIVYRGAVAGLDPAGGAFLRDALDDLLGDRPIRRPQSMAGGSAIPYLARGTPSYAHDIVPILAAKCLDCHSTQRAVKPFFDSYKQVQGWSAMIKETVLSRRMPPWGFDSKPGQFQNDFSLSNEEVGKLLGWIDGGSPEGSGGDPLPERFAEISRPVTMPEPSFSVSMPSEIDVPPLGFNFYQYYQLGNAIPRDMWIGALKVVSTNNATIHHESLILASKPLADYVKAGAVPAESQPLQLYGKIKYTSMDDDFFARFPIWTMGRRNLMTFGSQRFGTAFFLPKGYYLILEAHYHGTGKPERERTTLQFFNYAGSAKPKLLKMNKSTNARSIEIPPGAASYTVVTTPVVFPRKAVLITASVHMHMRGKSMKVFAQYPDGKRELLYSLPFFSNSSSNGVPVSFSHGKAVPAGTKVFAECTYDNSRMNPDNPDPTQTVRWGETLDRSEMCMSGSWYFEP